MPQEFIHWVCLACWFLVREKEDNSYIIHICIILSYSPLRASKLSTPKFERVRLAPRRGQGQAGYHPSRLGFRVEEAGVPKGLRPKGLGSRV